MLESLGTHAPTLLAVDKLGSNRIIYSEETEMAEKAHVDADLCTACGACVDVCPVEAIKMNDDETLAVVDKETCTGCGDCVEECPTGAIELKET